LRMGRNMKAILGHVWAEPGQWTALTLARDFDIPERSVRKSLRRLEEKGLITAKALPCNSCGHLVVHYFPAKASWVAFSSTTPPKL
jgi:predicted ArsR family transcriptional regulator